MASNYRLKYNKSGYGETSISLDGAFIQDLTIDANSCYISVQQSNDDEIHIRSNDANYLSVVVSNGILSITRFRKSLFRSFNKEKENIFVEIYIPNSLKFESYV